MEKPVELSDSSSRNLLRVLVAVLVATALPAVSAVPQGKLLERNSKILKPQ
jgi:hypothetical protein